MGPMKLYFDVRDIFRAPRLALSGKKIWIFLFGLLGGYIGYWFLTYLSLGLAGVSFTAAWARFGLYPCLYAQPLNPWYAQLVYWIGIIFWFFTINLACTAVARVTYKQLKGDEFYSSGDAWKFVRKHWHPAIFTSVALVLIIVFFVVMAIFFALFGKIPYVGEFLFALPYVFYFFGSVFTIYTVVVFLVSFLYTPAIVGAYEEDTMGAVFQSYSITWSQPWRVLVYHLVLLPIGYLAVYVFGYFWFAAYRLINIVFGMEWLMGSKLANIVGHAIHIALPSVCCTDISDWSCAFCFGVPGMTEVTTVQAAAGVIVAIVIFLLLASVVAYGLSIMSVGETIMFVIFKKRSDDDNLLERKDEEELEAEEEEKETDTETLDTTSEEEAGEEAGEDAGQEPEDTTGEDQQPTTDK